MKTYSSAVEEVVKILMERDDMSRKEALEIIEETKAAFAECDYDSGQCEDLMLDLGLEPDYLFAFI